MNFYVIVFASVIIAIASCAGQCGIAVECREEPICGVEPAESIARAFKVVVERTPNRRGQQCAQRKSVCEPETECQQCVQRTLVCEPETVCQQCAQRTAVCEPETVCQQRAQRTPVCEPETVCQEYSQRTPVCEPEPVCQQCSQRTSVCEPEPVCQQCSQMTAVCEPEPVCQQCIQRMPVFKEEPVYEQETFCEPEPVGKMEPVFEPSVQKAPSAPAFAMPVVRITFLQPKSESMQSSIQEGREGTAQEPICEERGSGICSSYEKQVNVVRKQNSVPLRSYYKNAAGKVCNRCNACHC
ncbi:hypothetical protein ACOME3_004412 [Neoechinorhynchus agilis]